ncbi:hypothetical protein O181_010714 [Austropuccinia psidii MF-1]|uniref:Uncharacterized protein n=1 Tax=Austropuccinia psidii MF-1 TaxID=1389203 RepID=A0A9Q3BRL1_9BASI|nr:hypothetical protein [Austropuccinia psidii MF-1]
MLHTQNLALEMLMPGKPSDNAKNSLCLYRFPTIQIIAYTGAASRQLRNFLMWVQEPNTSHAKPYACTGSQQLKQFLTPGKAFNNSHKYLRLYRFPTLHMHILTLVQVPNNLDHSLRLGSLPKILKIPYKTKINGV